MNLNFGLKGCDCIKIGEVSRLLNISIDTIRYYMDLGLIIPGRNGNLYDFAEDSIEDIRWIHKLKEMGFSLKEIQRILSLRRTSNWVEPQEIAEYLILLQEKKKNLGEKIKDIQKEIERIEEEENTFALEAAANKTLIGVPLKALEYLKCPCCGETFQVEQVQMNSRYIYSGKLNCACGYGIEIQNGIIITPDACITGEDRGDIGREKYKNLPASVITMLQRSYNFILHRMQEMNLENKVILETDINEFFYLYTHFRKLKGKALFIVCDRHPEVLRMYKERIEYMKLDLDIVYLAAQKILPVKPGSADIVIDYFSANYHEIHTGNFFPDEVRGCLKDKGALLGCYYCREGAVKTKYRETFWNQIIRAGYEIIKERQVVCPREIGKESQLLLYEVRKKQS